MFLFNLLKQSYVNKKVFRYSQEQIKALQQKKFLQLVSFVNQKSPYYQKIIKKYNIAIENCTPEDFPILTKTDLLEHFDEIVTDKRITKAKIAKFLEKSKDPTELFLNQYIVIHTSGSSGTVSYYIYNQKEFIQGIASTTRADGIKLFQKLAFIGATKGHFAGVTMVSIAKKLPFLYTDVQTFDINGSFTAIIDKLNQMQPAIISGYAFALRKLAEAQNEKRLTIKPHLIQSGGEPLNNQDKAYIQKIFNAPIINIYAASEHLIMGIGRDSFGGMYLMEDSFIFEIQPTYTNVTNLYNYTLPLIRYQMSDHLQSIDDKTKLMPFTKIANIVGRKESVPIFITDNGEEDFISPHVLGEFYVKNLNKFQIHLVDKKAFIFKVCLDEHITKEERIITLKKIEEGLRTILKEKQMTKVKFDIEVVADFWVDPKTGKFRLITKQ